MPPAKSEHKKAAVLPTSIIVTNQSSESVIDTKEYDQKYLDAQGKFDIRLYGKDVARDLAPLAKEVADHACCY